MKKNNALQIKKNTVATFQNNQKGSAKTPPTESAYTYLSITI